MGLLGIIGNDFLPQIGKVLIILRDMLIVEPDEKERDIEYLQSYIYTIPPGAAKKY